MNSSEERLPETGPQPAGSERSQEPRYGSKGWAWQRPAPTVLTWQDLADLPRQILPEETYIHCKNARTEAALALFSLWQNINNSRNRSKRQTRRRRIEVE